MERNQAGTSVRKTQSILDKGYDFPEIERESIKRR